MSTKLSVNVNKVACLRNARGGNTPNVAMVTQRIIDAGADGITVHPRPDRRHITPEDVIELRALCQSCEFNIEGNPLHPPTDDYPGIIALAKTTLPDQVTLVPDNTTQITSNSGWNFDTHLTKLTPIVSELNSLGIRVSLFVNPDKKSIEAASTTGCHRVELYTEDYAIAYAEGKGRESALHYQSIAEHAISLGLSCNAGHDLNAENLRMLTEKNHFKEVSIGQALIADALLEGIDNTIAKYLAALQR